MSTKKEFVAAFDAAVKRSKEAHEDRARASEELHRTAIAAADAAASKANRDGSPGAAWCHIQGANKSYPSWAKRSGVAIPEPDRMRGGVRINPPESLSYHSQVAWSLAYAEVIREHGIEGVTVVDTRATERIRDLATAVESGQIGREQLSAALRKLADEI